MKDAAEIKFDDNFIYDELGLKIEERTLLAVQFLQPEAQVAFKQWLESTDKNEY